MSREFAEQIADLTMATEGMSQLRQAWSTGGYRCAVLVRTLEGGCYRVEVWMMGGRIGRLVMVNNLRPLKSAPVDERLRDLVDVVNKGVLGYIRFAKGQATQAEKDAHQPPPQGPLGGLHTS